VGLTPRSGDAASGTTYFLEQSDEPASPDERPELAGVMQAIAAEDYGWILPAPGTRTGQRSRLSRESICLDLSSAGFEVEQIEEFTYEQSAEAQRAWLSVPIFTKDRLPGLPYEDRIRVLDRAYQHLGPGEAALSRWVAFAAKASGLPS
jgi:hypothetical protein